MNFWTAMVAIAGIFGIVMIVRYKTDARRQAGQHDATVSAEQAEAVRALEERIRTLERIVTDDKEALKRRFDEL